MKNNIGSEMYVFMYRSLV